MSEHQEHPPAEVLVVRTAEEALVVAALLRQAGIPVYVGGRMLQDEFAVAQRMLNLQSASVAVPADRLDQARQILAEARQTGRELAEEFREDEPGTGG